MPDATHLYSLLSVQRELLTRLLELSQEEALCLQEDQLPRLHEIVHEQSRLLAAQGKLSSRVTTAIGMIIAEACGGQLPEGDSIYLTRAADYLSADDAQRVRALSAELQEMMEELRLQGRLNWYASQQALKFVDFTLRVIGRDSDSAQQYDATTQPVQAKSVQVFMDSSA